MDVNSEQHVYGSVSTTVEDIIDITLNAMISLSLLNSWHSWDVYKKYDASMGNLKYCILFDDTHPIAFSISERISINDVVRIFDTDVLPKIHMIK